MFKNMFDNLTPENAEVLVACINWFCIAIVAQLVLTPFARRFDKYLNARKAAKNDNS